MTGGPLPQITIPLEARVTERGIDVQILRLAFDLKIRNQLVGRGEIGAIFLPTHQHELPVSDGDLCADRSAASEPSQGRITLTLAFKGLLRYRHYFPQGEGRAQGLGDPDTSHIEPIGNQGLMDLDVQVARSDWYEQVVERLGVSSYLITPLYLPYGLLEELLAEDVIAQALREAPPGTSTTRRWTRR